MTALQRKEHEQQVTFTLPRNEDAEAGLLSSLMRRPDEIDRVSRLIGPDHFYSYRHQLMWRTMAEMAARNEPVDLATLTVQLRVAGRLDDAGGPARVTAVYESTPTAAYLDTMLSVVLKQYARRRLIAHGLDVLENACAPGDDPADLLRRAQEQIDAIQSDGATESTEVLEFFSPGELATFRPRDGHVLVGDNHITRGGVFVIGGAPGVGKSKAALALAVAGARCHPWLGLQVHGRFKTMILQNENGRHRLSAELSAIGTESLEGFVQISSPPPFGIAFDRLDFRRTLASNIDEFAPDVVILDPWNSAVHGDKQSDYLETFERLRSMIPAGDDAPAIGIVAHTRKPRAEERAKGRSLLHLLSGSLVLGSVPRSVFVMQSATDEVTDRRVVWTCCKNNDGELGERSAWLRGDALFSPVTDFDWDAFDTPADDIKGVVSEDDVRALFAGGRMLSGKVAVAELMETTECGQSTAYGALSLKGRFGSHLRKEGGLLRWEE